MSGSHPTPAEQHLGDRLAALVDGELGHDARERVLAHLATCPKCKAEADAQRRLKSVFAQAAPPPPSESFLARLQGLSGEGPDDEGGPGGPLGGRPGLGGSPFADRASFTEGPETPFAYTPAPHTPVLPGRQGFRIHEVSRPEQERPAPRGRRRFAFAAAGAVSLAAIALGGVTVGAPTASGDGSTRADASPMRSQGGSGSPSGSDTRRRGGGPLLTQGSRSGGMLATPLSPVEVSAPLLPGVPAPVGAPPDMVSLLAAPMLAGGAAMPPPIAPAVRQAPGSGSSADRESAAPAPGLTRFDTGAPAEPLPASDGPARRLN
ncbi:anti-sigma factor family protein [Streptomyces sp. NPDC058045]|uniref:anti-sigma factor family protein n=1 Tax=Streptomyces sp. NPDC058045 TaxID=3346311 RepID=UPI0036E0A396